MEETEELPRREEAQSHAQQSALPLPEEPIARTSVYRTARRDQTRTKMVDNIEMLAMQIETLGENDELLYYDQTGPFIHFGHYCSYDINFIVHYFI